MSDNELPDWTTPYLSENYTGPMLSDGKFQESVANGKAKPKSKLDRLSRTHDHAYAVYKDRKHRYQADVDYQAGANKIGGFVPRAAGFAVRYLNQFGDGRTLRDTTGNLRGALKGGGGENMSKLFEQYLGLARDPNFGMGYGGLDTSNKGSAVVDTTQPHDRPYVPFEKEAVRTQPALPDVDPYDNVSVNPKFEFQRRTPPQIINKPQTSVERPASHSVVSAYSGPVQRARSFDASGRAVAGGKLLFAHDYKRKGGRRRRKWM